jgi:hypothetical protein
MQTVHHINDNLHCNEKEKTEPWSKPANGWTKLNLDADFCEVTCIGSWRVMLRNEAKVYRNIQNSATAKAAEAAAHPLQYVISRYALEEVVLH